MRIEAILGWGGRLQGPYFRREAVRTTDQTEREKDEGMTIEKIKCQDEGGRGEEEHDE